MSSGVLAAPLTVTRNNRIKSNELVTKRETNVKDDILPRFSKHANDNKDDREIMDLAETQIFRPKLQLRIRKSAKKKYSHQTYLLPVYYSADNIPTKYAIEIYRVV